MSILACIVAGLASACAYAGVAHLVAGLRQSFRAVHLVFALLAILVAGHALSHIGVYSAQDVESYLAASNWSNLLGAASMAVLPWFAYVYAAARKRWIPTVLSAFYILVIVAYELTPIGSQMRAPPQLVTLILPWGEEATIHVLPHLPTALMAFWLVTVCCYAYIYALCLSQYRRGQRKHAIVFSLSITLLPVALVANMFVLLGELNSLFLGEFGFVSLVLLMTLFLSSDESYRALVAQASDGIFISTSDGRYIDVNRAGLDMLGYSFEELRRLYVIDVVQREEHKRFVEVARQLETGEAIRGEWRFRRKNGASFIGEVNAQMLSDGRMLGVVRDITEHARVHNALRLLAQLGPARDAEDFAHRCLGPLTEAFGAEHAAICIHENESQSLQSLAVWAEGAPGGAFRSPLSLAPSARLNASCQNISLSDAGIEFPDYAPFARQPVYGYFGAGIFDAKERLIGIVEVWSSGPVEIGAESRQILEVFADRIGAEFERAIAHTQLQQLTSSLEARVATRTAELAELNKQLEAFSYSVSHDLRAPVRAVNAFAGLLLAEQPAALNDEAKHYLHRISAAGARMNELIEGLLVLARASHQQLHREPVDLCELAREIVSSLRENDPQRQVEIVFPPAAIVQGDRRMLNVAMTNLIENAWKYTRNSTAASIEFCLRRDGDDTVFSIRDNGVGFDMRYTERLFEPFHRLHSPSEFPGSGIGLATVARILQRHGGRIWAQSAPGEGATFYFTIPGGSQLAG
ncbi:PAS domain S-box-containing protein [Povalibacter uvarum]|uniref:histidine kinase n=1 Tax=Povalibacter uvarum TaxID=732238 RepID=A0A841HKZ9_9GAMM|nr:ATP-binding protein [Povalibacter uvarum]MBB6093881.1 PAS domain S-box-containing protein [Povalibacter uvarum]